MNENIYTRFPVLTTGRLILRQIKREDENEIFTLRSDELINKYLDRPKANSVNDAKEFINKIINGISNNKLFYWGITEKDNDKIIGTICLWNFSKDDSKAEIGFELLNEHQGKGIMQEAVTAVIKFGFENMQLNIIDGEVDPDNIRSIALLQRNNFILDKDSTIEKNTKTLKFVLQKPGKLE